MWAILNRASKRLRLPGYSRRRNLYWRSRSADRDHCGNFDPFPPTIPLQPPRWPRLSPKPGRHNKLVGRLLPPFGIDDGVVPRRNLARHACALPWKIGYWPRPQTCFAPERATPEAAAGAEPCPDALRVGLDRGFSICLARNRLAYKGTASHPLTDAVSLVSVAEM